MNFFKRIEVILLLLVAIGGAVWVLSNSGHGEDDSAAEAVAAPGDSAGQGQNKLHRVTVERDFGNARLDIEVRLANRTEKKLVLQPPQVKLVTDAGREVPPFFLPFNSAPEIPAGSTQDVRLRYWLEKADLAGGLKLVIGDESIEVKSAAASDLEKLENKKPKVFKDSNWAL